MKKEEIINLIKNKIKVVKVSILFFLLSVIFAVFNSLDKNNELEVIFLDVGQGDATLIKSFYNQNILIDTGANYTTNQRLQKELSFLNKSIDKIILTHPDKDHVGGLDEILKTNKVKDILISSENNYEMKNNLDKTTVSLVSNNNSLFLSNLEISIISPTKRMLGSNNAKSIVSTLKYGNFNFIFTGDADNETERNLVSKGYFDLNNENKNIKNILKVGHHGSDTSSSEIFLKKIKPEYCVISVGKDNTYGHPSKKALERLEKYCKNIFRTDLNGSVSLKTNGKDIVYVLEK